ncbi:hypothetical protein EYF80_004638 [Liparis tanakae]|uniref:Uncharacterized protein n=1 Tax=Liparis tanakae TaxID=230148 RepID=A0A4Z2J517_9TELE|nr:hypothetical protein EYF80_004638 [Liparis tanakae]
MNNTVHTMIPARPHADTPERRAVGGGAADVVGSLGVVPSPEPSDPPSAPPSVWTQYPKEHSSMSMQTTCVSPDATYPSGQ